jgi:hypothetical protein
VTDYGAESLNAIAGNLTADGADDTEKKRRNPNRGRLTMVFFQEPQMDTDEHRFKKRVPFPLICGYLCLSVAGIGFESPAFRPALEPVMHFFGRKN